MTVIEHENIGKHNKSDTFQFDEIGYFEADLKNDKDYKIVFEDHDRKLKMFAKESGEGSEGTEKRHKYFGYVNEHVDWVYATMRDAKFRLSWDTRALANESLETINDRSPTCGLQLVRKRGQYMLSHREFLTMTTTIKVPLNLKYTEDGTDAHAYYLLTKSVDDQDEKYPPTSEYVRGFIHYFALKVEPAREGKGFSKKRTKFSGVIAMDMGGWIPTYAYNWGVTYLPQEYQDNVTKGCKMRREMKLTPSEWQKVDPLLNQISKEALTTFRELKKKLAKEKKDAKKDAKNEAEKA